MLANVEMITNAIPKPIIIKLIHAVIVNPFVGFTLILWVRRLINAPAVGNNTHKNTNIEVHLAINSTKEYKLYNQIEIEVGLLSDKKYNNSFKIINRDYTEKSFFHIYINNDTTKVNGQYGENIDKNCKIKVKIDFDKKSLKGLFKKCFYHTKQKFYTH